MSTAEIQALQQTIVGLHSDVTSLRDRAIQAEQTAAAAVQAAAAASAQAQFQTQSQGSQPSVNGVDASVIDTRVLGKPEYFDGSVAKWPDFVSGCEGILRSGVLAVNDVDASRGSGSGRSP